MAHTCWSDFTDKHPSDLTNVREPAVQHIRTTRIRKNLSDCSRAMPPHSLKRKVHAKCSSDVQRYAIRWHHSCTRSSDVPMRMPLADLTVHINPTGPLALRQILAVTYVNETVKVPNEVSLHPANAPNVTPLIVSTSDRRLRCRGSHACRIQENYEWCS
jgi:hypothetical protein